MKKAIRKAIRRVKAKAHKPTPEELWWQSWEDYQHNYDR
jgi:hypothetical protein